MGSFLAILVLIKFLDLVCIRLFYCVCVLLFSYWGPLLVHNMCLVHPVLSFLDVHVLKVLYEQNKWNGMIVIFLRYSGRCDLE